MWFPGCAGSQRTDTLWERRASIIATFAFLRRGDPSTSLELAESLLHDPHDLVRKAAGWTLREMGWRVDREILRSFRRLRPSG